MDNRVPTASRPRTGARPTTSARPLTSTGLVAPKTARGKTAGLRRQVQDKSYWINVIKSKMTELSAEITNINKECESMAAEQSRMSIWQKQAENLARELGQMSNELSIYNEFKDRMRLNESVEVVKEDTLEIKEENDEITARLEKNFEEKKQLESMIKNYKEKLKTAILNRENIQKNFTPEQRMKFEELESENRSLSAKISSYENEIDKLKQRQDSLIRLIHSGQNSPDGGSSFMRREILSGLGRLKSLEKQKDELLDQSASSEKVTGKLLAQVKRNNKEISGLELHMSELTTESRKLKEELDLYNTDTDVASKYQELKKRSEAMDSFLEEFNTNKAEELEKVSFNGKTVNETIDRINRIIAHIDSLRESESLSQVKGSKGVETLLDDKRRLELDLSKMIALETKISSEMESLRDKNQQLEAEIETYGDIGKLKNEMEEKSENLKEEKDKLAEKSDEIRKSIKELKAKYDGNKSELNTDATYKNMKLLETKLSDLVATNHRMQSSIDEVDNSFLKSRVMDEVKKYNQKLQGY